MFCTDTTTMHFSKAQRKKVAKVSRIPVPQAAARSFSGLTDSPRLIASEVVV